MAAISLGSAFLGYRQSKKAEKAQKAQIAVERQVAEKKQRIDNVRNLAERAERLRRLRAAIASNTAAGFQGASGGGNSTLAAANAGITTTTAANIGKSQEIEDLGFDINTLGQQALELGGQAQTASSNASFLFSVAQKASPSMTEYRDLFSSSGLFGN